jgi:hypothetical protein
VESRAAAKGLLADSKHLLDDSRAGLRRGMEQLASKAHRGGSPGSNRGSFEQHQQGQDGSHSARASLEVPAAAAVGTPAASPQPAAAAAADAAADAGATSDNTPAAAVVDAADEPCTPDADAATSTAAAAGGSPAAAAPAAPAPAAPAPAEGGTPPASGVVGGLLGTAANAAAAGTAAGAAEGPSAAAAVGVDGAKSSSSRRGVVVMLLAEGLEVVGEKGTKVGPVSRRTRLQPARVFPRLSRAVLVLSLLPWPALNRHAIAPLLAQVPNIRAARLGLEVECVLSASLTYSRDMGWQSAGERTRVLVSSFCWCIHMHTR